MPVRDPLFDDFAIDRSTRVLVAVLAAELDPGEAFLWVGRPRPGLAAIRSVPLASLGFGAAFLLVQGMLGPGNVGHHPVALLLVLGLGIGVMAVRAALRARRTIYAITDRRALIREPMSPAGFRLRSLGPDRLGSMECRGPSLMSRPDLIFESVTAENRFHFRETVRSGFQNIRDAPAVARLVRSTLLAPKMVPTAR